MGEYELRPIRPDEEDAYLRAVAEGFQGEMRDEEVAHYRGSVDARADAGGRARGRHRRDVGGDGAAALGPRRDGADGRRDRGRPSTPCTAAAACSTAMMRGHLAAIRERGEEPLAALWASEAAIYGRWGFGAATRTAHLTVRSPEARLTVAPSGPRLRAGTPEALLDDLRAVHAAVEAGRAGVVARDDDLWRFALADFEADRDGAGRLRAVVQDGADGPEGYALFAVRHAARRQPARRRPRAARAPRHDDRGGVRAVGRT